MKDKIPIKLSLRANSFEEARKIVETEHPNLDVNIISKGKYDVYDIEGYCNQSELFVLLNMMDIELIVSKM